MIMSMAIRDGDEITMYVGLSLGNNILHQPRDGI